MTESLPLSTHRPSSRAADAGFTLVELVVALIVLSVMALGVTSFITYGTRIYVDSQEWQQELGNVRYAAQRLSRELRDAVPGSVVITNSSLEFAPIAWSERYLAAPRPGAGGKTLLGYKPGCADSNSCSGKQLIILDGYGPQIFTIDQVYNVGSTDLCSDNVCDIVLVENIPASAYSVGQRYFVAEGRVRWHLDSSGGDCRPALTAIAGMDLCRTLINPDGTELAGVLMGEGVSNNVASCDLSNSADQQCAFLELPVSLNRNSVVRLQWWVAAADQQQRFVQEVQLENVP